ncbi:MAG: hypothetical protein Q9224_007302 [Gallowayella concinna]
MPLVTMPEPDDEDLMKGWAEEKKMDVSRDVIVEKAIRGGSIDPGPHHTLEECPLVEEDYNLLAYFLIYKKSNVAIALTYTPLIEKCVKGSKFNTYKYIFNNEKLPRRISGMKVAEIYEEMRQPNHEWNGVYDYWFYLYDKNRPVKFTRNEMVNRFKAAHARSLDPTLTSIELPGAPLPKQEFMMA